MVDALKKLHLWYENYQTLYMVHKHCLKYVESHAQNKYYKFHKGLKSFQIFFGLYWHFLVHNYKYVFHRNIFQSTIIYIENN
jgi:hypothetical protein